MSDSISPEVFEHLVRLAALELDPQEAEYLRGQLNHQLKAIHELEAIPLEASTPTTSHGVPYTPETTPPIRPDEQKLDPAPERALAEAPERALAEAPERALAAGKILAQAPELDDGYIIVPEIPHTEL